MSRNIVIFVTILLCIQGCATTKTHWEPSLWQFKGMSQQHNKNVGTLQDENFIYEIIVTDFGKVSTTVYPGAGTPPEIIKAPKTLLMVAIRCRNKSNDTAVLNVDPIQIIDASKTLAKKLTPDEVLYKLYGGRIKDEYQRERLKELKIPIQTDGTLFDELLGVIVEAERVQERAFIIDAIFEKERALYDFFHKSFEPVSLPSGVATAWIQYYHYTHGDIHILLQGQNVSDGLIFTPSGPTQQRQKGTIKSKPKVSMIDATSIITGVVAIVAVIIILAQIEDN